MSEDGYRRFNDRYIGIIYALKEAITNFGISNDEDAVFNAIINLVDELSPYLDESKKFDFEVGEEKAKLTLEELISKVSEKISKGNPASNELRLLKRAINIELKDLKVLAWEYNSPHDAMQNMG